MVEVVAIKRCTGIATSIIPLLISQLQSYFSQKLYTQYLLPYHPPTNHYTFSHTYFDSTQPLLRL